MQSINAIYEHNLRAQFTSAIYKRNLQLLCAQQEIFLSTYNLRVEILQIVRFYYTNYYSVNK